MPGFDGTGPHGEGAMTGRGRGRCFGRGQDFDDVARSFGRGGGRGRGRRGGPGFGRSNTQMIFNLPEISEETELSVLKEQVSVLENTLEKVKNRISELEK